MQVHPDIAALRGDRAPQREAQTAILTARKAWMEEARAAEMLAELDAYGSGAPLEDCPVLSAVFTRQGEGERLMRLLSRHYCIAIGAHPLGHPPFRIGYDGRASSILLARSGRAQLLLQAREIGEGLSPGHIFSDATRFDAVLAGEADARIVRIVGRSDNCARFASEALALRSGSRFALDLSSETLVVDSVLRRLVVLRLQRTAVQPQPGREYCADTGQLLHQSAGDIATSRQEAIIALLGRMGREDAATEIARLATGEGDTSLRWQALREVLALDTAAGFLALADIACRIDDPLADQAAALRVQLLETYPQIAAVEEARCPA